MKNNSLILLILVMVLFLFSQCSISHQYIAYRKVHNKVEKTDYYKSLNKYQKDFLILASTVKESYPNCREYINDSIWQKNVNASIKKLQHANDTTAALEAQKFLALLQDNHSYVDNPSVFDIGNKIFMVCIYYINGKWIVMAVHKDYPEELIKTQVVSINDIPVDTFYSIIKPYLGEQSEEIQRHAACSHVYFGRKAFINSLGLGYKPNHDSMKIIVRDSVNIEKTYMLAAVNLKDAMKLNKKSVRAKPIVETDSGYVYRFYPESSMAYLQINEFMDKKAWKRGIKEEVPIVFRPFAYYILNQAYKGKPIGRLSCVKRGTEDITKFYEDFLLNLKNQVVKIWLLMYGIMLVEICFILIN